MILLVALLLAAEQHPGIETVYGFAAAPGGPRVRTIVTAPRGAATTLPGIFVVGWLSCDSVELARPNLHGVDRLLLEIVRGSGALVMRMEKPGLGGSEGNCARTDFDTELAAYRAAFAKLLEDPRLDRSRVMLVGISNGGGFAPLVAGDAKISRIVSVGGWAKTWFEHMIALERRRVAFEDEPSASLKKLFELHAAYLFEKLTPAQVVEKRPWLAGVWYDEAGSQYGRPASFYHQLQSLEVLAAWKKLRAPALIVWGEYDWIMDRSDQELLRDAAGPGSKLLVVPRADHILTVHPDARAAYRHMGAGGYPSEAAKDILDFLRGG
jgi:pimeloyl-ACP methyl ester carboxylesterase